MEGKSELKFTCDCCGKEVEGEKIKMMIKKDFDELTTANVCEECYEQED